MIHPHTRLADLGASRGFGVVATAPLPAGTIIWVRDLLDQRIPRAQAKALGPLFRPPLKHFTYWEPDRDLVLCWDHARFVNHHCEPTCLGAGYDFQLAVRDIEVGEEITDDYSTFGYAAELPCTCGSPRCRGTIRRSDAPSLAADWDRRFAEALRRLPQVEQLLWSLVSEPDEVLAAIDDPARLRGHPTE